MYKSKFKCQLFVGSLQSKNRRISYVSSAEYTGDSIVIHLSDDECFVDSPLCYAVPRVLECCKNLPRRFTISTEEVYIPSSDCFASESLHFIEEYKRVYGIKALVDLIAKGFSRLRADQEVSADE